MTEATKNTPLISVIIPTYRRARDLDRCIKSVLAQPGDFFEVVVGDGGYAFVFVLGHVSLPPAGWRYH